MERIVTTLLDVLGLLLLATGTYYLVEPAMGRAALLCAGGVVLAGSALASRTTRPARTAESGDRFADRLRQRTSAWRAARDDTP